MLSIAVRPDTCLLVPLAFWARGRQVGCGGPCRLEPVEHEDVLAVRTLPGRESGDLFFGGSLFAIVGSFAATIVKPLSHW